MAVNARRRGAGVSREAGIVRELPNLPYPLYVGKITWQDNFDQNVTGSIEYTALTDTDIDGVQNAYPVGSDVNLYGILFSVTRFSYSRQLCDTEEYEIDIYSATITLEGKDLVLDSATQERAEHFGFISYADRRAVSLVGQLPADPNLAGSQILDAQQRAYAELQFQQQLAYLQLLLSAAPTREEQISYQSAINNLQASRISAQLATVQPSQGAAFARTQIISDGGNEIAWDKNGYNNTEVTGGFSDGAQIQANNGSPRLQFRAREPRVEVIREFSKDFNQPPENTYVLRDDTSQCFDDRGQKKVWKESRRVNGQPDSEIIRTKGFAYLYEDIAVYSGGNVIGFYSSQPASFWVDIEERRTQYVYRRADPVTLSITVTDIGNEWVRVAMHPDYTQFASFGAGILTYQSRAEFLVDVITEGWQLVRLKKETETDNRLDARPGDGFYEAYSFKRIPFYSRTSYLLASPAATPGVRINPPFSIDYSDYDTLEQRFRSLFSIFELTNDRRVALITPDINFVEPLYVKVEGSASNSFTWMEDPEGGDPGENTIPGTNTPLPPNRLTTGEESWNETRRTIIDSDLYSEMITEYSSQDPGFDNVAERIMFRENTGSPPSPTYRMIEYEQVQSSPNQQQQGDGSQMKYVLNTANGSSTATGGSVSFTQARSQEEARIAAEVQLRKQSMQSSRSQKTIFGFHPSLRCGQPVVFERDRYTSLGQWRIMTIQWELEYKGIVEPFGLLVTTPGTQLTLGLDKLNPVTISRQPNANTNPSNSRRNSSPTVDVQAATIPGELGTVLPRLETRRNF